MHPFANLIPKTMLRTGVTLGMATILQAAPLPARATQDPPSAPPAQVKPDNAQKNERDRDGKQATPMDQGRSAQDLQITRDIRRGLQQAKDLSTAGKNVKVITVAGHVTLRGPVASAAEKQLIKDLACKIAGPSQVKDELEVK